ncbi:MAG: SDR family NAD(P)-dependent oxidoreductase [Solirubrobacteraceae bacterium]
MTRRFEGKRAIVTGASRGLGLAIAKRLAVEGAELLICARGEEQLRDAATTIEASGAKVRTCAADLADWAQAETLVELARQEWDTIDVLINNAGILHEAPYLQITAESWRRVMAVLLDAPFRLSQLVAPTMIDAGSGAIVNITSIDGHAADGPFASYAVAKAGLIMLTKNIAVELGPSGVRCNALSPGWTRTEMIDSSTSQTAMATMQHSFARVPLRRLLRPDEIAATCAFLASDEASAITGAEIIADGGMTADMYVIPTLE